MNLRPAPIGPLSIARKRNQEVSAKPNAVVGNDSALAIARRQQQSAVEENRAKALGSVGGSLGAFLNASSDMPHEVTKRRTSVDNPPIASRVSPPRRQPDLQTERPYPFNREPREPVAPGAKRVAISMVAEEPRAPLPMSIAGGAAAPSDLIELVYRNNAEASRRYLEK